ncbi:class I SAM-dependent methyltransferase [Bradyrhizobium sp. USDA 3650]
MTSTWNIAVVSADAKLIDRCQHILAPTYLIKPFHINEQARSKISLKDRLRQIVSEIIGLADGSIETHAVIIDAEFKSKQGKDKISISDSIFDELPAPAGNIISSVLGAGLPLIANSNVKDPLQNWAMGRAGVIPLNEHTLMVDLEAALDALPYLINTLRVENEFATGYDEEELGSPATVSAVLWENEFVLRHVREHIRTASQPLHILDLGCGTGRFEELLLTDREINQKIATITAVDFAPMYFGMAKRRLPHFLAKAEFSKINFVRRIAEDLRWPANYFDIVVASFGILCFSNTHKTLPNVYNVLKPGGLVTFNGYNRDAITFEFDEMIRGKLGNPASHFAISIDRDENTMRLGDRYISCFTFHPDDVEGLISLVGFKPVKSTAPIETFPALYGSARKEYLARLTTNDPKRSKSKVHFRHGACVGTKACVDFASYQHVNLVLDGFKSGFNETLHQIDGDLAKLLPRRGFYFCVAAHK